MPRSRDYKTTKGARLKTFFETNPGAMALSNRVIAEDLGISINLVAKYKIKNGYVPRPYARRRNKAGHTIEPAPDQKELEVEVIAASPTLTTESKRRLLTKLAESDDSRTEARISAIRELHRIDESIGSAKELGPGIPLSIEDRVSRLSLLIAACGPTVHSAALALAKKEWD